MTTSRYDADHASYRPRRTVADRRLIGFTPCSTRIGALANNMAANGG